MGAACKKNTVRQPKRDLENELAEKRREEEERLQQEKEEQLKREEEQKSVEESVKETVQEENEVPESEVGQVNEAENVKSEEVVSEQLNAENDILSEKQDPTFPKQDDQIISPREGMPTSSQLDQDEMTPHEKYDKLVGDREEVASEDTMSTEATRIPNPPKQRMFEGVVESSPRTGRSATPFDMTVIDKTAKGFSKSCGCDLGDGHDENNCIICKSVDLSDAPLLN